MVQLNWDATGARKYEKGVDRGVLYVLNPTTGLYKPGVVWNGLTNVTESPTGAEATPQYADNMKYLNLVSQEDFAFTIEAFTYPDEFEVCEGNIAVGEAPKGAYITGQDRATFAFSYRTLLANDTNPNAGYKIHVVWGALAAPTEKSRDTVNESPEAATFSWECTTTPVAVTAVANARPTAHMFVDSTKISAAILADVESALYGTSSPGADAEVPTPDELIGILAGA